MTSYAEAQVIASQLPLFSAFPCLIICLFAENKIRESREKSAVSEIRLVAARIGIVDSAPVGQEPLANDIFSIDLTNSNLSDATVRALKYFPNLQELSTSRSNAELFKNENRPAIRQALKNSMTRRLADSQIEYAKPVKIGALLEDFEEIFDINFEIEEPQIGEDVVSVGLRKSAIEIIRMIEKKGYSFTFCPNAILVASTNPAIFSSSQKNGESSK